jgi:hypothetical protein
MADDPHAKAQQERSPDSRIDLRSGPDVDYWTQKLGVSAEQLAKVVELAGDRAGEVQAYLAQEGRPATTE